MNVLPGHDNFSLFNSVGRLLHRSEKINKIGGEITPCNKIDKPLVVYRFSGNVIMSMTMLLT